MVDEAQKILTTRRRHLRIQSGLNLVLSVAVLPFIAVVLTFLESLHLQTGGYKTL
jgi:hypothetical protein